MHVELIASIAPLLMVAAAVIALVTGTVKAAPMARYAEWAAIAAFVAAAGASVTAILSQGGASTALPIRADVVSLTMLTLVTFVGWVVVRYAGTYLAGETGQTRFTGWLAATLAAVMLLVVSGDLIVLIAAWIATSFCLHRLLVFRADRPGAQRAAAKKFLMARLSDAALIAGGVFLWFAFETTNIGEILQAARISDGSGFAIAAAACLAIAAILKSAQFPSHGWLTEVMEAPTPVSALLHAGVINAGGFLLIRFADVMLLAPGVLAALVMVGGFTALFGALVMLTQPAVKTSLAWSTISQMGFMILQCGLALFPLALLHIVAHSLYKAHAFLASGSAVDSVAAIRRPGPVAIPGGGTVLRAFAIALVIYAAIGFGFDLLGLGFASGTKSPQAIALGAILIFGVAYLVAQGFADAAPWPLTVRTSLMSVFASLGYFALQASAEALTVGALPATPAPGPLEWALIVLAVTSFGGVALAQSTFPLWSSHPAAVGLRVHLANGLYANAMIDRLIRGWAIPGRTET